MSDKMRWRLAHLLDRLPFTCWASLVSWAMRGHGYTLRRCVDQRDCRRDAAEGKFGDCYCGKISLPDQCIMGSTTEDAVRCVNRAERGELFCASCRRENEADAARCKPARLPDTEEKP